jgi:hypothetical protein
MKRWIRIASVTALLFASAQAVQATAAKEPSHAAWQALLTRYLDTTAADGVFRFRYSSVLAADKAALDAYLDGLQKAKPATLEVSARRAFWINLYNAETVAAVLKAYPIKSIRDIRMQGMSSPGPWDAKLLKVEGLELSLNDIENLILRRNWADNRIHFALNCASIGCPNLSPRAFTGANLETQLEQGARAFLRSPRGIAFNGNLLILSSLFEWYRVDFGRTDKEMLETLGLFTTPETGKRLKAYVGRIEYQYDWNLNGK